MRDVDGSRATRTWSSPGQMLVFSRVLPLSLVCMGFLFLSMFWPVCVLLWAATSRLSFADFSEPSLLFVDVLQCSMRVCPSFTGLLEILLAIALSAPAMLTVSSYIVTAVPSYSLSDGDPTVQTSTYVGIVRSDYSSGDLVLLTEVSDGSGTDIKYYTVVSIGHFLSVVVASMFMDTLTRLALNFLSGGTPSPVVSPYLTILEIFSLPSARFVCAFALPYLVWRGLYTISP